MSPEHLPLWTKTIEVKGLPVYPNHDEKGWCAYALAPNSETFLVAFIPRNGKHYGHWKVHISAYPQNAQEVAEAVLPILYENKLWHKYVKSPQCLNRMVDGERGKFITIYTKDKDESKSGEHTKWLCAKLKNALKGLTGPDITDTRERKLDHMIYCRYCGNYTSPGE